MKIAVVGDQHITGSNPRCRKDNYLDSILNKIEQILATNDIFIGLGDLFDSASIDEEALNRFLRMVLFYKELGKKFYVIHGNHDLFKHNMSLLDKTSLGTCFIKGIVEPLPDALEIGSFLFKEIPFVVKNPELPYVQSGKNIVLLGHYFFESHLCPKFSVTREMLEKYNSYAVVLGHDHVPYETMEFYGTLVYRPGSLCRNTDNDYNYGRIPRYLQFDFTEGFEFGNSIPIINYVSLSNITTDIFTKKIVKAARAEVNSKVDLDSLVSNFGAKNIETITLSKSLKELNAPDQNVSCIQNVYNDLGLTYT